MKSIEEGRNEKRHLRSLFVYFHKTCMNAKRTILSNVISKFQQEISYN